MINLLINLKYQARSPSFLSSICDSRFFLSFLSPFLYLKEFTFVQTPEFIFPFYVMRFGSFQWHYSAKLHYSKVLVPLPKQFSQ
jgi:hypothetical protein